jgi:hypothetical protein
MHASTLLTLLTFSLERRPAFLTAVRDSRCLTSASTPGLVRDGCPLVTVLTPQRSLGSWIFRTLLVLTPCVPSPTYSPRASCSSSSTTVMRAHCTLLAMLFIVTYTYNPHDSWRDLCSLLAGSLPGAYMPTTS